MLAQAHAHAQAQAQAQPPPLPSPPPRYSYLISGLFHFECCLLPSDLNYEKRALVELGDIFVAPNSAARMIVAANCRLTRQDRPHLVTKQISNE